MLDIKDIRSQTQDYKTSLARKGVSPLLLDELLELDQNRIALQQEIESLKAQQNEASKKIPTLSGNEKVNVLAHMKTLSETRKEKESAFRFAEEQYQNILFSLPNPPHKDAPDGKSDEENQVIRKEGTIPQFDFPVKDHADLAEILDILDTERSAKTSGARFYYLKNELAILQRALIFWAFMEVQKKGFTAIIPPFMTRERALFGTGYLDKDENYCINPGEDDLYLIGTSEVPMVSYHDGEILNEEDMPARYVSYSPCFRREAGTYGKDTRGIFRVHQFEKVEMVVFALPENAETIHEELRNIEEHILSSLEIPYRVVNVCCGDLGNSAAKKYDLEAWLPGQNQYREMTSTSICTDFQTRRLNIRIRRKNGDIVPAYTLNGTVVSGRPLIAILENLQEKDGSVRIPKVLQSLCGFDVIYPKK